MAQRVLMVVTSADRLPSGHRTGVWLEEFAVPYLEFIHAGFDVTVASPRGGQAPIDPASEPEDESTREIFEGPRALLARTGRLSDQDAPRFYAVFFPGGHGPLADLPDDPDVQRLVADFFQQARVIGAMCHGPAGLLNVTLRDGRRLLEGRRVTAFTNAEEEAAGLTGAVPFLLEDALRERGARFVAGDPGHDHVEQDGRLITGQNPASARSTARAVVEEVRRLTLRPEARPG